MNNTIKNRYKNASRYYQQNQNSTWMVFSKTTAWTDETAPPLSDRRLPQKTVQLGGSATVGDTITIRLSASNLNSGTPIDITHTTSSGQTLADAANDLVSKINANATLTAKSITATYDGTNFPYNVVIQWNPDTITLDVFPSVTGSGTITEKLILADVLNPVIAVKASVYLIYEDPTNGTFSFIDSLQNERKFSAFPTPADNALGLTAVQSAIKNRCQKVLITGTLFGSDFNGIANTFRQISFSTDLIPNAGQNGTVLNRTQIASWGDSEQYENVTSESLTNTSRFKYSFIEQF